VLNPATSLATLDYVLEDLDSGNADECESRIWWPIFIESTLSKTDTLKRELMLLALRLVLK